MSAIKYWLWLSALRGLRPRSKNLLLERFGTPTEIFFAGAEDYRDVEGLSDPERALLCDKSLYAASETADVCAEKGIRILTIQDAEYPRRLANIFDPPLLLYVRGRLPIIDEEAAIAVVGTRKATPYGIKMARRLGYELTRSGGLVVSGLAEGVDGAAAEGALRASGRVVGVTGTAIDLVYPRKHARLFEDVLLTGAIVGEYPPGYPTMPSNFPIRNRLISGLSVGVTVIEAPKKSGALITAARALEQGRDLFVVPGNADSPACEGSNELLREAASPVSRGWDILSEYLTRFPGKLREASGGRLDITPEKPLPSAASEPPLMGENPEGFAKFRQTPAKKEVDKEKSGEYIGLEQRLEALSESQLRIIGAMSAGASHVDDIIEAAGLGAGEALAELTMLEIAGLVRQERGRRYTLLIRSGK